MKPEFFCATSHRATPTHLFRTSARSVAVALVVFRSRDKAQVRRALGKDPGGRRLSEKKTIVADVKIAGHIGSFGQDGKRESALLNRPHTLGAWHCQRSALCVSLPGTEAATLRRCGPTQHCVDARPAKMWLHLMQERDRSGTGARRRGAYSSHTRGNELRVER